MLKLSWISKLKPPVPKGAEPDETELEARYQYFHCRNFVGKGVIVGGMAGIPLSMAIGGWLANALNMNAELTVTSGLFLFFGIGLLGMLIIDGEKEILNKPLSAMCEEDQADVLRLIRFVPEARKLNERVRKQGRVLRAFDLEAMREFEKSQDEKRLRKERLRLERATAGAMDFKSVKND